MNHDDITYEGIEIGAVSVKWARLSHGQKATFEIKRHEGDPIKTVEEILAAHRTGKVAAVMVTGQATKSFFDLPYRSEIECLERALQSSRSKPDLLLSLGGETFSVYPMKNGNIRNIIASSKCAAGTGEFMVQQFQRMGLSLEDGLAAGKDGEKVQLATRCSVHCKSDATHKLNKGECKPGDIAASLIHDLAKKVAEMVRTAQWPAKSMVVVGGVSANALFIDHLRSLFQDADIRVLPESPYFEAFGAALLARDQTTPGNRMPANRIKAAELPFERLKPLRAAKHLLDFRVQRDGLSAIEDGRTYLLGVDAGSTTTKAVLLDADRLTVGASCYLRTLGDPVSTVKKCIRALLDQVGDKTVQVIQAGATGSGREMVSVYLNSCSSFNEILAHARAAAHEVPDVDTVFEIGGQDSKFISFLNGIPVDYAMNEGCSAGTGSFLEESASVDMNIAVEEISGIAEKSTVPIAFGERCAAFINTDLRNALQQGAERQDVTAGLVYSIAENYISRIVGSRHIGERLLFLGGVALNRSVGLAMAARTGQKVVVPPHPELMGCVGTALMLKDLLDRGDITAQTIDIDEFLKGGINIKRTFRCKACENVCEIKMVDIRGKSYPFGGLCSKYEMLRHGKKGRQEGRDLVALRDKLMFETFNPEPPAKPLGTIGLPMALSTFELFPFYAALITAMGYQTVLSDTFEKGTSKPTAAICYPCEIVHGAVHDLLDRQVDYIFLPYLIELSGPEEALHAYTCTSTTAIPDIIRAAFGEASEKIISPHISLSEDHLETTLKEIERVGARLGVDAHAARQAGKKALQFYDAFIRSYRELGHEELKKIEGEPAVIIAGRPYTVCAPDVNLALPRKIVSRGYHAVPVDMLPKLDASSQKRNVWYFTQQIDNATAYTRRHPNVHICLVSCFSCGPDSSMYHAFRDQLKGRTFCYLEIDSHTAHAGFETRIGAFLDIIEENERRKETGESRADEVHPGTSGTRQAALSPDFEFVLDSHGNRVEFGDPRIVHIHTDIINRFAGQMTASVYRKHGLRFRAMGKPTPEIMQYARKVCSGRECIPMTSITGAVVDDMLNKRSPDEIAVYFTLDQEGPCQNGAWPVIWNIFNRRLNLENIIWGVNRNTTPNALGLNGAIQSAINDASLLGDLFEEAENALKCAARHADDALDRFEQAFDTFNAMLVKGDKLEEALGAWAEQTAAIPLKAPIDTFPKVLVFGGLNVMFVHFPVTAYFIDQGIVPKIVEVSEGACWLASEGMSRHGYKKGYIKPSEQFSCPPSRENRQEALEVRKSRFGLKRIESRQKKFRDIMAKSGLLFDHPLPFADIMDAGHQYISYNGFTETPVTTGRYVCSLQDGLYDGYINLGSFNCQPAMNSQAIVRPIANASDIPYVALDCEGPWISANQRRLLEVVAVKAKKIREEAKMAFHMNMATK
ncbi:MAG: acyl-CoA dehydratase activase [Deltaproteobacteria bacterium]|nr:acyl-CoA dehydratase activase [Deltaproteobacteria bacterium]